jgi:hypothetical protein
MPELQSKAEAGEGAVICDLPTANGFMGVLGRSSKARCVDSQIAHESPPGTGLVLGTPQSNTVQGAT